VSAWVSRLGTETGCAVPRSGRPPRSGAVGRVETGAPRQGWNSVFPRVPCWVATDGAEGAGGRRRRRDRGRPATERVSARAHGKCTRTRLPPLPSGTGLGARGGSAQTVAPRCVMAGAGATAGDPLMFQLIPLFVASTIAVTCRSDGNHTATCQTDKCETVGSAEICTGCKAGGVPVDGFCWPPGSPQAAAAGCTEEDGTALDKTAAICEKCGDGYFLFMGGCYKTTDGPGNEICTTAKDGVCTTCKTDNGLFKNPAATPEKGSECILCSDATDRNGVTGVKDCLKCQAPGGNTGAATCTECQAGYYKDAKGACVQCQGNCATCETSATHCTSCKGNTFLKTDTNTCVEAGQCTGSKYPDPSTGKCTACNGAEVGIADCDTCTYDKTLQKPKCLTCTSSSQKIVREEADGTTTCIATNDCTQNGRDGPNFLTEQNKKCILCSNNADSTPGNTGVPGCNTCSKTGSGTNPQCKTCLDGYFGSSSCKPCGENCATCTQAGNDKCTKCKPGFFLKVSGTPGQCFACDSTTDGGREGCSVCSNNNGFKCTECKPNYKKQLNGGANDDYTCVKTCEDDTACGGTSGACDAIVIDNTGKELHYCSYCGDSNKVPIDGKCVNTGSINGNTGCTSHICKSCAQGYFLYMGGCYSTTNAPGNYMCKTAANGVCTTPNANNKYFIVPEAKATDQSVLACGNPLGTIVDTKAYVGVDGCSQCKAPAALTEAGMASATCTSCDSSKKPNKGGSGCFACTVSGCSHCNRDDMCEVCDNNKKVSPGRKSCVDDCPSNSTDTDSVCTCNDGYSPDDAGTSCVSSGANRSRLSTGAIAGISVAVIAVVGGLVGFLCWWFVCRGKA
ncbi:Variant-specific surface protein, partial [Giardia duodenalis]